METQISKSKFKTKALQFFREIEESGNGIVITDFGKPVLRVVPYKKQKPEDILKELRGSIIKYDNPTEPVGLEDWEILI